MTAADEQHLLLRARQGSHQAFGQLVERHMKRVYNLAFRFVNDHHLAEEVVQDTFVRAYKSLGSFRGDSEFGTWLHRIATNLSINASRNAKNTRLVELDRLDFTPSNGNGSAAHEGDVMRSDLINRALTDLPSLQRQVVILRHIEGHSTREVSRILECSEGTVKTHLFRGLKKLRTRLGFLKEEIA
jgi:RNA polymerase sigma-70 factor, ECF subfamily